MRTLFLHIGFHKTGSSSLQLALKQCQTQLQQQGYEFASLGKKGSSSAAIDVHLNQQRLHFRLNNRLEKLLASTRGDKVIISGEHFSFLHQPEDMQHLHDICDRFFDTVKIIVYLRRQDRQAVSFKQQAARGAALGRSSSSKLLGHDEGALPALNENICRYYDYFAKLQQWQTVFGQDALTVRAFESERLTGGDIVSDFASLLGDDVSITSCRVNEGIHRKEFLLTHTLLKLGLKEWQLQKLKPLMRNDNTRLVPDRAAALAFFQHFEESNRQLNDTWLPHPSGQAFNNDFDSYPEQGNDHLTFQDLAAWIPDLFAAGLDSPAVIRDALLAHQVRALSTHNAPPFSLELEALARCLTQPTDLSQLKSPWYKTIRKPKKHGR